jgi:hypothetical protein
VEQFSLMDSLGQSLPVPIARNLMIALVGGKDLKLPTFGL